MQNDTLVLSWGEAEGSGRRQCRFFASLRTPKKRRFYILSLIFTFSYPRRVAASNPEDLGMVALLLELCHPQAALEAATRDWNRPIFPVHLRTNFVRLICRTILKLFHIFTWRTIFHLVQYLPNYHYRMSYIVWPIANGQIDNKLKLTDPLCHSRASGNPGYCRGFIFLLPALVSTETQEWQVALCSYQRSTYIAAWLRSGQYE